MLAMLNFLITVIGAFVFGYFAGYFAGYAMPTVGHNNACYYFIDTLCFLQCVFLGLVFGITVFLADLYFLVRTHDKKTKTTKTD